MLLSDHDLEAVEAVEAIKLVKKVDSNYSSTKSLFVSRIVSNANQAVNYFANTEKVHFSGAYNKLIE